MQRPFLLLLLVCVLGAAAVPAELTYKKGDEFVFDLSGNVDNRGVLASDPDTTTYGTMGTLTGYWVFECTDLNDTGYLFEANLFDGKVEVNQGGQVESRALADVTGGDYTCGKNVWWYQEKGGDIPTIWYIKGDSEYCLNVKIGLINQFQTAVVPPGADDSRVLESDCQGQHYSTYTADGGDEIVVTKTFGSLDFVSFADPNLSKENVQISGTASVAINAGGQFTAASLIHDVVFSDAKPDNVGARADPDGTGWNIDIRGHGESGMTVETVTDRKSVV